MVSMGIKCGVVGVAFPYNGTETNHCRFRDGAVVEQHPVTGLDLIPQEVAGLKITYPVPMFGCVGTGLQILEGKTARFRFEEPVTHVCHPLLKGVRVFS